MQAAIKVNDSQSVIVTFEETENILRLTSGQGFEVASRINCFIVEARGLKLLGGGTSMRAPGDDDDTKKGMFLAFERAVKDAFPYDREARVALHREFREAMEIEELRLAASGKHDQPRAPWEPCAACDAQTQLMLRGVNV